MEITKEWIDQQRAAALEALNMQPCAHRVGLRLRLFGASLPAALDALEASMATIAALTEANKDALKDVLYYKAYNDRLKNALSRPELDYLDEIDRLTAELAAEKKRTDAAEPALEDVKQALCCGGFRELSAACSELWRIWDQNDPKCAENAPEVRK